MCHSTEMQNDDLVHRDGFKMWSHILLVPGWIRLSYREVSHLDQVNK